LQQSGARRAGAPPPYACGTQISVRDFEAPTLPRNTVTQIAGEAP
jgi:hypothetical protein